MSKQFLLVDSDDAREVIRDFLAHVERGDISADDDAQTTLDTMAAMLDAAQGRPEVRR